MKQKVKRALRTVASYIPTDLPQTDAAFQAWMSDVLNLAKLPENDSFANALATQVLHLGPTVSSKPKAYFVSGLKAAVSKQAAYSVVEDIRRREKAAREAQSINATEKTIS